MPQEPDVFDNTDQYFNSQQQPDYGGRSADESFINESLARSQKLLETDLKPFNIEWFGVQSLSTSCKKTLMKLNMSIFDSTKALAKLTQAGYSYKESVLELRIIVNQGRANYKSYDRLNPALPVVEEQLITDYKHIITRAENGWEREQQGKIATSSEQTQTIVQKDMRSNKPAKRGFFGLFG